MTTAHPDDSALPIESAEPIEPAAERPAIPVAPPTAPGPVVAPALGPQETELGMRMLIPIGRSPFAIVAGYLGLLSITLIPAPFALLFGIAAVVHIRRGTHVHGMGRAVFAIVMGVLGSILLAIGLLEWGFGG